MQYDKNFLLKLDKQKERDMYVRIIAFDNNDHPLETIEGKITGGSINVDGSSAIRRTCSLTMIAGLKDTIITDSYWCFNTKISIEIGLVNAIDDAYPPIIWFKQGIFIITSFTPSHSINNLTISLQAKDKMCRLNGDISGSIFAQTDFGQLEEVNYEEETSILTKIPIKDIIRNAVRAYGGERDQNIIVNDLDEYGYELWQYTGADPLYYFKNVNTGNIEQISADQNITVYNDNITNGSCLISELEACGGRYYSTNILDPEYNSGATAVKLSNDSNDYLYYYIIKIEPEATAGYHRTKLVYNTDLILNAGETITSLLDKLKNMLGNFEYFYDINGKFIFQKKKDYIQELWSTSTGALSTPILYNEIYSYKFEDESQFTAINVSPNISNIKNDFSVWGNRESVSGEKLSIHARCAIDKKPISYISPWERYERVGDLYWRDLEYEKENVLGYYIRVKNNNGEYEYTQTPEKIIQFNEQDYTQKEINIDLSNLLPFDDNGARYAESIHEVIKKDFGNKDTENITEDWQIISDYKIFVNTTNISTEELKWDTENMENGPIQTSKWEDEQGYEILFNYLSNLKLPIYAKLKQNREYNISKFDWREIIYQMSIDYLKHNELNQESNYLLQIEKYNPQYLNGKTGYEQYYVDINGFWRQLYNPNPTLEEKESFEYYVFGEEKQYWNKAIHSDPSILNFWFEFIDTAGELSKYSANLIGSRNKVANENTVTSIYNVATPEIQFILYNEEFDKQANTSFTEIQINENAEYLFNKASQGVSAISKINELIQTHSAISQTLNLTCIPIFYLQPNTRIYVNGEGYEGDYTIDKISYNLSYNGTMSISGNKIFKQFI